MSIHLNAYLAAHEFGEEGVAFRSRVCDFVGIFVVRSATFLLLELSSIARLLGGIQGQFRTPT